LDNDLILPSLDSAIARVFSSGIRDDVDAELNLARFIASIGERQKTMCMELSDALESYLKGL